MAFISQRNMSGHVKGPIIRFRQTKSGAGGGTISKAAPFRGERIDIQVCEESRRVRIGIDQRGVSCGAAGQFSCSLCSGQLKLATALEFFQYRFSDSFGGNPPL